MTESGVKNPNAEIESLGIKPSSIRWNLTPEELIEDSIKKNMGVLSDTGALSISTGRFTGRAPKDRFIVEDDITSHSVDWGKINKPISADVFQNLKEKIAKYLSGKEVYVHDGFACARYSYRLNIRLVAEYPWSAQFANNMFLRFNNVELRLFTPDWHILCAPGFQADPEVDGTRSENFAIINFSEKTILIGGTGYTGEIKKGIFSVLNFVLPKERAVLSMHCSANVGPGHDTAIFFGLSGTGKTTLSADPRRFLIGDDEHGWADDGVFNFEGGCYAKCIDLTEEKEPDIYNAIKHGAILENIVFHSESRNPDFSRSDITQNTRVSYPLYHIKNAAGKSKAGHPKNVFFLTADAFGVLPPISKLKPGQAMYHFISGYTAKVAGTEDGINEPQATFSACFGAPFMPLHPTFYAEMLGIKMQENNVNVWLVNTGWTGGPYGVGKRISLRYTRAMIQAALEGKLDYVAYQKHEIFGLRHPKTCPDVPSKILNPKDTWSDKAAYDKKANELAASFVNNFSQFSAEANEDIMAGSPVVMQTN